jgi:hypothetical protein
MGVMKYYNDVLSIYETFVRMIRTHFDTPNRVFHADSTREYLSGALRQFLSKQDTLP